MIGSSSPSLDGRRVVTGLNAAGRSCAILDGAAPVRRTGSPGLAVAYLWQTDRAPASNVGDEDAALALADGGSPMGAAMPVGGTRFLFTEIEGKAARAAKGAQPLATRMHSNNAVVYTAILKGQITLLLEEGEVQLGAGDVLVDRGVPHSWHNRGDETVIMVGVMVDAEPVDIARSHAVDLAERPSPRSDTASPML
jgi:mannose-6-phosphate isomerase-like protein (cupin superfamily)